MTDNILAQFKANQGLSYKDVQTIFNTNQSQARKWVKDGAPTHIDQAAIVLNTMMERWKSENGAVNDVDRQHHAKHAENLQKRIHELEEQLRYYEAKEVKNASINSLRIENQQLKSEVGKLQATLDQNLGNKPQLPDIQRPGVI